MNVNQSVNQSINQSINHQPSPWQTHKCKQKERKTVTYFCTSLLVNTDNENNTETRQDIHYTVTVIDSETQTDIQTGHEIHEIKDAHEKH